jgi:hypothetical protein
MYLSFPVHATCPPHLIVLHLIIIFILDAEYKLWSSTLCSFLQPLVTSSLFGPNKRRLKSGNAGYPSVQNPLSLRLLSRHVYNFVCGSVWVWNLVSDIKRGTWTKGVWEDGAEENATFWINLIYYCRSQIFKLCHIFKRSVNYLSLMILPFILVKIEQHTRILSFLRLLLDKPPC